MTESSTLELNQKILDLEARMRGLPIKRGISENNNVMSENIKRVLNIIDNIPATNSPNKPVNKAPENTELASSNLQNQTKKATEIQQKDAAGGKGITTSIVNNKKVSEKIKSKLNQVSIESFCENRIASINNLQNGLNASGVGSCSMESERLSNSLKLSNNDAQVLQNNSGSKIIAY